MTSANKWNSTYDLRNTSHISQKRKQHKRGPPKILHAKSANYIYYEIRKIVEKDNPYTTSAWWVHHHKKSDSKIILVLIRKGIDNVQWYTQRIILNENRKIADRKTRKFKSKEAAVEYYHNAWNS